jgi:benzoate-CoA ligase family protein
MFTPGNAAMTPQPLTLLPDEFNAATYFIDRHIVQGRGQKVAIECGDQRVTYQQLFERVNQAGNCLRKLAVRIEERVVLLLFDVPDFAASFFGTIKIGAVPVPINTLLRADDYTYLLNDSRARVAIVSEGLLPLIKAIPRQSLQFLETVLVAGTETWHGMVNFDEAVSESSSTLAAAPTNKDDAAFWLYSSGSTGRPKACVHLQHDMVVSSEAYAKGILNITESDRCFSVSKLFFAYGLGNGLYFPLSAGATSILLSGPPRPDAVFEVIEGYRPTLFFSVPSNYARLLAYTGRADRDFDMSSVRWAVSAGEALPAIIFHRFHERFGVQILDALGSTEALHMVIANRPGCVRPGSSGQVIPGFEARIVDDNNRQLAAGEIGNLIVKADSVCAYYWNQHEKTKDTIEGHWVRTGDKYYQDDDGFFWYAGRSDDMLKVGGVWVSPIEIENVLLEHVAVREAAVVARPDEQQLVHAVACVVVREGFQASAALADELQAFVSGRLGSLKRPHQVEFHSELPKTATGKLQRYRLRAS